MLSVHQLKGILFLSLILFKGVCCSSNNEGSCKKVDLSKPISDVCDPCEKDVDWLEIILNQRQDVHLETGGNDTDTGDEQELKCFNSFPLGLGIARTPPEPLTKGASSLPVLNMEKVQRGFIITNLPFFRYNNRLAPQRCLEEESYNYNCPYDCQTTAAGSDLNDPTDQNDDDDLDQDDNQEANTASEENFDIGGVRQYYNMSHAEGSPDEVDLQLVEWPGRKHSAHKMFLEDLSKEQCYDSDTKIKLKHCKYPSPRNFQMLKFQRESSKLLHYPCNMQEGTRISAFGVISVLNRDEMEDRQQPHNTVYIAYDKSRIFHTYTQPLYISEHLLNEMAKPEGEGPQGICQIEEQECTITNSPPSSLGSEDFCSARQLYFEKRGEIIFDKTNPKCQTSSRTSQSDDCDKKCVNNMLISDDLRTALDFTFVQGRLIIGMRCGIIVVDGLLLRRLDISTSNLLTESGLHKNTFRPVTKIASNYCCTNQACRSTIIAGYPSSPKMELDEKKEIYISYDLGRTFIVKLIVEHQSVLNLIWGMYKMYSKTYLFRQLLEQPDEEDLEDEEGNEYYPGYKRLRQSKDWDSLTLEEKEQRFLFGETRTDFTDVESAKEIMYKYVKFRVEGTLRRFVRLRQNPNNTIFTDPSPHWLQHEVKEHRIRANWQEKSWTDANCDSIPACRRNFVNDPAVKYFLGMSGVIVKTPIRPVNEYFCDQIVSLAVLEEEDSLYALCLMGFGEFDDRQTQCSSRQEKENGTRQESCTYKGKSYQRNDCVDDIKYYAIYTLNVNEKLPVVLYDELQSERLFTCKPMQISLDWEGCKKIEVQPEIVRVPNSITLLVKNCEGVLYYSPNGGRTIFNTEFYAHHSEFLDLTEDEKKKCSDKNNVNIRNASEQNTSNHTPPHQRQQMYRLKALNVPPQIEISPQGNVVLMTMKNKYAYGLLGVNKEFRMIVGDIFPDLENNILARVKSNDYVFPSFTADGTPFFGVALKLIYFHNPLLACKVYNGRNGMRLVHMDAYFYKDTSHYYFENTELLQSAKEKGLGIEICHTLAFTTGVTELRLDVGESSHIQVRADDIRPNIPLAILSSEEKSILVDVDSLDKSKGDLEHLTHDWDIHIHAIKNYKARKQALIDSFFGVENNNMYGYYTKVSLANSMEFRCHVQPASTITVHIECRDNKLAAHEGEHRPQCTKGTFSKHIYTYTLKKGDYDPDIASYWRELDAIEGKNFIKLDRATGNLEITYDYLKFGCPLEPYRGDPFLPDLRIISPDPEDPTQHYNTSHGELYNGTFILIELFGAKGFKFSHSFQHENCQFAPINVTKVIREWIDKKRMFKIAYGKQANHYENTKLIADAKTINDIRRMQLGSQLFSQDAVDHPSNIINRVTYRDCKKWRNFLLESENVSQSLSDLNDETREQLLNQELPIMKRTGENKILWDKKSQPIYIFLAVALDPSESLCEYQTIFGVSIPDIVETEAYIMVLIFFLLVSIWIGLFLCGYFWRKSRIRQMTIDLERKRKLEEAAWKIVYRYEKLLQEHENFSLEQEFQEFREIEANKQKARAKRRLSYQQRKQSLQKSNPNSITTEKLKPSPATSKPVTKKK